jgi:hypothetical protein
VKGKASVVTAPQRQLLQYLRGGDWVVLSKIPIAIGKRTLKRMTEHGWIECRGKWP